MDLKNKLGYVLGAVLATPITGYLFNDIIQLQYLLAYENARNDLIRLSNLKDSLITQSHPVPQTLDTRIDDAIIKVQNTFTAGKNVQKDSIIPFKVYINHHTGKY